MIETFLFTLQPLRETSENVGRIRLPYRSMDSSPSDKGQARVDGACVFHACFEELLAELIGPDWGQMSARNAEMFNVKP